MRLSDRKYHRLVVVAEPGTVIWLVDDSWHPVQQGVGTLDASFVPGRYFLELNEGGLDGVAYPVELFGDLQVTQSELEAGPACQRLPPIMEDDDDAE